MIQNVIDYEIEISNMILIHFYIVVYECVLIKKVVKEYKNLNFCPERTKK